MGPQRLLLVDDEETILFALSQYFRGLSYRVDCAREREEAQALLSCVSYGCLVTDVRLSQAHGREGLELASFVYRSCASTRVVILTAYAGPDVEALSYVKGVDAILAKPIALETLADQIRRLVAPC
jgi:two-component system OmpR family response regulator